MADRFPDYDVLAKRETLSWNAQTRTAIDARLALPQRRDALSPLQFDTLAALIDRIVPPPEGRPSTNALAVLLDKITEDRSDGFRPAGLPPLGQAWRRGLDAIDAEARLRHGCAFAVLPPDQADALLAAIDAGEANGECWREFDAKLFWSWRLIPDVVGAYYTHPSAWSAIGFGGPAGPRGYVRLRPNSRDPWEAAEADDGALLTARFRNRHVG